MIRLFSFSYRDNRLPADANKVIDCRGYWNPHMMSTLRHLDGKDPKVQEYLSRDKKFVATLNKFLATDLQGLSIHFGCIGGRHRSVAMAEMLGKAIAKHGEAVEIRHLNLP